jgi:hypothetical protein
LDREDEAPAKRADVVLTPGAHYGRHPEGYGGLVLDAAYPVDRDAYEAGKLAATKPPADDAVKKVFVLVGDQDGGLRIWDMAEADWRKAGVPLTIDRVAGGRHEWLATGDHLRKLLAWLGDVAAGKRPTDVPSAPAPKADPAKQLRRRRMRMPRRARDGEDRAESSVPSRNRWRTSRRASGEGVVPVLTPGRTPGAAGTLDVEDPKEVGMEVRLVDRQGAVVWSGSRESAADVPRRGDICCFGSMTDAARWYRVKGRTWIWDSAGDVEALELQATAIEEPEGGTTIPDDWVPTAEHRNVKLWKQDSVEVAPNVLLSSTHHGHMGTPARVDATLTGLFGPDELQQSVEQGGPGDQLIIKSPDQRRAWVVTVRAKLTRSSDYADGWEFRVDEFAAPE